MSGDLTGLCLYIIDNVHILILAKPQLENLTMINRSVIGPPILPDRPDVCEYSCNANGGCSVALKTHRRVGGASKVRGNS